MFQLSYHADHRSGTCMVSKTVTGQGKSVNYKNHSYMPTHPGQWKIET